MSISLFFSLNINDSMYFEKERSVRLLDMNETEDFSDFSNFEIGLARFCCEYNSNVSMLFGDQNIQIELWTDIWDLIVLDMNRFIPDLINKKKSIIYFTSELFEIRAFEYYDSQVHLDLAHDFNKETVFTDSNVCELINELLNLATHIISLAVQVGYVNPKEANDFLSKFDIN